MTEISKNYLELELEKRMREDSGIWEFLQRGSLDGVWYWDLENPENEWMSPEFWRLLGIDPATKKHDPAEWQDLIFPEDLEVALDNFHKHCEDPDHPYDQIVRYRHADGSTVWVRCRGIALRDDTGKPIRLLGAHNDLTEIKNTERRLHEAEFEKQQEEAERERLASENRLLTTQFRLLQLSNDAELAWTRAGGIQYWNQGAINLYGFSEAEALGRSTVQLLNTIHPVPWTEIEETIDREGEWQGDIRQFKKDGTHVVIFARYQSMMIEGHKTFLESNRDVTLERESERVKAALNMELLRSNRDLDNFAYVASHDLKEPLRGITINANFMLKEEMPDHLRKRVKRMVELSGRMENLISDLLTFSRLGQKSGSDRTSDVSEILSACKSVLEEFQDDTVARLEVLGEFPTVYADPTRVRTVFQNLIANALQYNRSVPKIVQVGFVRDIEIDGEFRPHAFFVKDNGIGIRPEFREKVFDIFTRLNPREEFLSGSGAGLSFVKRIIEGYGGWVRLDSEPDEGSVFYFALPIAPNGMGSAV